MRWAIIGGSDIAATRVMPAMRQLGHEVVGVVTSDASRARAYATNHELACSTSSIDDVAAWGVGAAYISSTNERHAEQAVWAADHGLHILCEKPLALSVADARRMVAHADAADVVLATNHHLRSAPVIRTAADLVRRGDVGELRALRVHHAGLLPERLRGWRVSDHAAGAGVILDVTVHDADLVRFVSGGEVSAVTAMAANQQFPGRVAVDTAVCVMELEATNAVAMSHESFALPHAVTALEVHGTEASLYLNNALSQDPIGELLMRRNGVYSTAELPDHEDLYVRTLRSFERAARGDGQPTASGRDGLLSLAVALAASRSAREGRRVGVSEVLEESQ